MAEWTRVASLAELQQAGALAAKHGDHALALFWHEGRVLATQGQCPHAGGPLHKGTICAGKLSCPWHGWTYDLASGECEESDDVSLARYEVRVDGDQVHVAI